MNVNLLRSKMALNGDNQVALAEALEITPNTLCFKMAEKNDFKVSELDIIVKRYNLSGDEIKEIFFS